MAHNAANAPGGPLLADLLVTGTDTGVGKTVIAAALVLALRNRGVKAAGFKPVETGLHPSEAADSEVLMVASAVDLPALRPLLRLPEALAPALAAERAGTVLHPAEVESRVETLRNAGFTLVVEGAGGALVPLCWGYTVLDLAVRTGLEAVVVARAGLGTLNHVALTLEALARRHVPVRGVVLNGRNDPPELAEATNPEVLARLFPAVRIVVLSRQPASTPLAAARAVMPSLSALLPA
jgi:dethiobiotin synthetase